MMEPRDDAEFFHDEAGITVCMIAYVTEAANSGKRLHLSDDRYVFVLLVYWVCLKELQRKVQED